MSIPTSPFPNGQAPIPDSKRPYSFQKSDKFED
jgi:hypothetical protein